jgi:hypothetical protein
MGGPTAWFPVSAFMMLEFNLHSKVSLSRRGVLHDPEPNILVPKRFVASFPFV